MCQQGRQGPAAKDAPKRRRVPRGEVRRSQLVLSAESVFLERGYTLATMSEVASRAGASKETLYRHFGTKEALFAEIVRSTVQKITDAVERLPIGAGSTRRVLVEWGLEMLRVTTAPQAIALFRIIVAEGTRVPELGRTFYEHGPAAYDRRLSLYLQKASQKGQLRCPDPLRAAQSFRSMIAPDAILMELIGVRLYPTEGEALRHVEEAVKLFLARYGSA